VRGGVQVAELTMDHEMREVLMGSRLGGGGYAAGASASALQESVTSSRYNAQATITTTTSGVPTTPEGW
jgi:hypothetical protein